MRPLVSICCTTYNHEKYIADAIESFLMQKTDFPFEVIIHDDASTDGTADIVRKYESKHPNIIKGIYQTENQYSKGVNTREKYISKIIRGKYIATCEGDDYWIDENKLKKQIDFMEKNPEYILCSHRVQIVDTQKNYQRLLMDPREIGSRDYTIKDIEKNGFIHISSRVYKVSYYTKKRQEWMKGVSSGDHMSAIDLVLSGKVYFMEEIMSAYRIGVKGSIMTKFREETSTKEAMYIQVRKLKALDAANRHFNYEYNDNFKKIKNSRMKYMAQIIDIRGETPEQAYLFIPQKYKIDFREVVELKASYAKEKENILNYKYDEKIISFFKRNKIKKIAIYGCGTIGEYIKKLLSTIGVRVVYFVEDIHLGDDAKKIYPIEKVATLETVDAIIVTPYNDMKFIVRDLEKQGIDTPIISVEEVFK